MGALLRTYWSEWLDISFRGVATSSHCKLTAASVGERILKTGRRTRPTASTPTAGRGGGGRSGTVGGRSPGASFGFYLREVFQSQTNAEKDIIQQESLDSDML